MKKISLLLAAVSIFCLSSMANARISGDDMINTSPIDRGGVVAPGTRLAAGDPNQNEFYILGASPIRHQDNVKVMSNAEIAKIKVAINESLQKAARKKITSKSLAAAKAKKHKIAVRNKHHTVKSIRVDG